MPVAQVSRAVATDGPANIFPKNMSKIIHGLPRTTHTRSVEPGRVTEQLLTRVAAGELGLPEERDAIEAWVTNNRHLFSTHGVGVKVGRHQPEHGKPVHILSFTQRYTTDDLAGRMRNLMGDLGVKRNHH